MQNFFDIIFEISVRYDRPGEDPYTENMKPDTIKVIEYYQMKKDNANSDEAFDLLCLKCAKEVAEIWLLPKKRALRYEIARVIDEFYPHSERN